MVTFKVLTKQLSQPSFGRDAKIGVLFPHLEVRILAFRRPSTLNMKLTYFCLQDDEVSILKDLQYYKFIMNFVGVFMEFLFKALHIQTMLTIATK